MKNVLSPRARLAKAAALTVGNRTRQRTRRTSSCHLSRTHATHAKSSVPSDSRPIKRRTTLKFVKIVIKHALVARSPLFTIVWNAMRPNSPSDTTALTCATVSVALDGLKPAMILAILATLLARTAALIAAAPYVSRIVYCRCFTIASALLNVQ